MKRKDFNFNSTNAYTSKTKKYDKIRHNVEDKSDKNASKLSKISSKNKLKANKIVMMF